MTLLTMAGLFVAAILAGSLNAVAGGGSFITFPALLFSGVQPIAANATNTVALWPGSVASVGAYRRELAASDRTFLVWLSTISLLGGILGAVLLLRTPQTTFVRLVPFLLLTATVLFIVSPRFTVSLRRRRHLDAKPTLLMITGVSLLQLVISTYGGYFGGGMGIMLLATLGLLGMENLHQMNALKTLLTSMINGVAVITFVLAGTVLWPQALVMVVGAIIGGYVTAKYVVRIDPRWIRWFVIAVGMTMSLYFFFWK